MPRTPVFRLLQRTLTLARLADGTGEPVDELVDRWRSSRRVGRREVLAAGGAAGLGLVASACAPRAAPPDAPPLARPSAHRAPVVIVGAGISGLTAAYRLAQAGVPVRVLEGQNRVGGRMLSLRNRFPDGQVIELGGELVDSNHTHLRGLAAELGIEFDDLAETGIDTTVWHFGGARRSDREIIEAWRPVAQAVARDLEAIRGDRDVSYRTPLGAESLDRLSLAEWLDRHGVTGWFRDLLDVGYTTEYGLEIGDQSALNLLLWIDPAPDPFNIYGDSDERYHVRGGNDLITHALARRLEGAIETTMVLEAIRQRADGQYVLACKKGGGTTEVIASHVLLTLPFTMLRQVTIDLALPAPTRLAVDTLGYGNNAKLMIAFARRVWREAHSSNGTVVTDLPFQVSWETSRAQGGAAGVLTNFTGGRQALRVGEGSAADQARAVVADLDRVFPGIAATRAGMPEARFHWPTHPFVRASYAALRPGQWTTVHGASGEAVGGLHFSGEHTSLQAQGFMEGGCETGERAAREIIAQVGTAQRSSVAAAIEARLRHSTAARRRRLAVALGAPERA